MTTFAGDFAESFAASLAGGCFPTFSGAFSTGLGAGFTATGFVATGFGATGFTGFGFALSAGGFAALVAGFFAGTGVPSSPVGEIWKNDEHALMAHAINTTADRWQMLRKGGSEAMGKRAKLG